MGLFGKTEKDRYNDDLRAKRAQYPNLADSPENCPKIQIQIQQLKNTADFAAKEQIRAGCDKACKRVASRSQKVCLQVIEEKKAQLNKLGCSSYFQQEFNQAGQQVFDEFTERAEERIGADSSINASAILVIGAVVLIGAMVIIINR